MKKIIVLIVFAGIFATIGITAYETGNVPQFITDALNQFRQNGEENVIALSGNVEVTEVNVGFTLGGRIQEMFAAEGQTVRKGATLALLENIELAGMVAQNKAVLREAMTRLNELKKGSRNQEIEQAKAGVTGAEAALEKAQKDFRRAEALYQDKLIPVSQLDAAKNQYEAALAQHTQAVERLSLVQEGPTKDAVRAAQYRVEQAQAAVNISEERLNNTTIYAPMDGVILHKNVEAGEILAQGTPVYTIGDLEKPWIKVYVKEDKLGHVKLGQSAQVTIDSFPDKIYEGTLTYISPQAEFTPKTIQTKEERVKLVFAVKVSVKNLNGELKPGMPADVKILLN